MNIMIYSSRAAQPASFWRFLLEEGEPKDGEYLPEGDQDRTILNRLRDVLALR